MVRVTVRDRVEWAVPVVMVSVFVSKPPPFLPTKMYAAWGRD